ncbi:hypothetical protein D9615_005636 [Tricholomella constricta]|uniref:Mug135-like C-terminal domain-containing protein n=1 Tax=Tricholomella constricta TaxID=117010 RepID=A0A8H5HE70_9AGAR|nr:hypothetical protein D9615_005636 [Tricholomella constricta]
MPVPLPNPPAANTPLPPQPQEPPTREDIANAITYNEKVLVGHEAGVASEDQVRAGAAYEAALIAQNAGDTVPPPWFAPAMASLTRIARNLCITHNCLAGDGRVRRFEVIPFHDGTLPTDPPHNLPPLVNVAAINALTGPQATAYLRGYGRPIPRSVATRRRAIRDTVGCTAES